MDRDTANQTIPHQSDIDERDRVPSPPAACSVEENEGIHAVHYQRADEEPEEIRLVRVQRGQHREDAELGGLGEGIGVGAGERAGAGVCISDQRRGALMARMGSSFVVRGWLKRATRTNPMSQRALKRPLYHGVAVLKSIKKLKIEN